MMMVEGRSVREVGTRIEALLDELRSIADPRTQRKAEELVHLLVDLYGAGLGRVVDIVAESDGHEVLERLADDALVASLLVLHGLHPVPVEARIQGALEKVRPYLGSHAGGVEYLGLDEEGRVHLRLEGSCHGCPSSTVTVRMAIDQAIEEAAPEVTGVEVEGVAEPAVSPVLMEIRGLGSNGESGTTVAGSDGWSTLGDIGSLAPGELRALEVDGARVVVCSAAGSLYAYRNVCTGCGSPLHTGRLDETVLSCGTCGARYDVRLAGRGVDLEHDRLDPLPLLESDGGWRVGIAAAVTR